MRAVNNQTEQGAWTVAMLADVGGRQRDAQPLVEFIVRADDGATLSIVQPNEPGFRTGDRVVIQRDTQTRLARPG